jgi:toxin CcdB
MSHLDVYPNRDARTAKSRPYVVELQSDLLNELPTTIIAPLARPQSVDGRPVLHLNPNVNIGGKRLVLLTQDIAAVPRSLLKAPVANLSAQRADILAALDFLFTGF